MAFYVPICCISFSRYCGKMYSRHLFSIRPTLACLHAFSRACFLARATSDWFNALFPFVNFDQLSLVYTYDASISISTRNLRVNQCDASISALRLRLCLCLRRSGLHVRRNDASISTSTREWNDFHSLVLVLSSLRRTCKPERRKH